MLTQVLDEEKMIGTDELEMKLEVLDRTREGAGGPYMEWLNLEVRANVPGFTADIKWSAMPMELQRFRDELLQMNELVPDSKAELKGTESGVKIIFRLLSTGQINGEYEFYNRDHSPDGAVLRGSFKLDQSFLPGIISKIDALLAHPARKIGA